MAANIVQLFNDELPGALERNAEDVKTINAKFQLNIEDSGEWFIDCSASGPSCKPGNPGGADVTMSMSSADFDLLHQNPQTNGMQLFFQGKLKVQGNQMLAMKLSKLFAYK